MEAPISILVIDDDSEIGELVSLTAQNLGLPCAAVTSPNAFIEVLTPDVTLVLLDLLMPEMDGIELLRILGQKQCRAGIVLMSGTGKRIIEIAEQFAQSIGLSIVGTLRKPFRIADLEAVLGTHIVPENVRGVHDKPQIQHHEVELHRAIEHNEFVLHYQPQIDLSTGKVVGVEALVRWQHPEHGLIFPDDFIAQAESLGLIDQLGWLVANRAMAEIGLFNNKTSLALMLSINVSVFSLRDLKFPDTYVALLKQHNMPAEKTTLEITESGLIQELSATLDVLTRLRLKRVHLSIDDFGTGYSMMQQVRHIPATELKIDKSFVQNMLGTDGDRVMVRKTIEIGHELGMKIVAEGVETQEQLDFLRVSGCNIVQGYLFSRPLPLEGFEKWILSAGSGNC